MHTFARAGHSGIPLHFSDFVSTVDGHSVYHLFPLFVLATVILGGLAFLWIIFFVPDYSTISVPSGCLTVVLVVLFLIAITCIILVHFPAFVLF